MVTFVQLTSGLVGVSWGSPLAAACFTLHCDYGTTRSLRDLPCSPLSTLVFSVFPYCRLAGCKLSACPSSDAWRLMQLPRLPSTSKNGTERMSRRLRGDWSDCWTVQEKSDLRTRMGEVPSPPPFISQGHSWGLRGSTDCRHHRRTHVSSFS